MHAAHQGGWSEDTSRGGVLPSSFLPISVLLNSLLLISSLLINTLRLHFNNVPEEEGNKVTRMSRTTLEHIQTIMLEKTKI